MLKITGGTFRNRQLRAPRGNKTRPTAGSFREALFNICRHWIDGARVLDLFAGSGAVGLEALSRGAESVFFAEKDRNALHCLKGNIELLGVKEQTELHVGDAFALVRHLGQDGRQFDLIYLDPPYRLPVNGLLHELDNHGVLADEGVLFIERRQGVPAPEEKFDSFELIKTREMGSSVLYQYRSTSGAEE